MMNLAPLRPAHGDVSLHNTAAVVHDERSPDE